MSTFSDLQTRVSSDHLNRSGFTTEIKRAIKAAIRHYERQRWRFNETASVIAASVGQAFLTLPTNFLSKDHLRLSYSGATNVLLETTLDNILQIRSGASNGVPTHYTIYANRIELAVVPDSAYNCPLYYLKSLPELSADADTNSWTNGAFEDLIVYSAAKRMWASVLRNPAEAQTCAMLELGALQIVQQENVQFQGTHLRMTEF